MVWWFAAGALAMSAAGSLMGYAADKKAANAQAAYQRYRNAMVNIGAAQQQNAATTNLTQTMIASGQQAAINATAAIAQKSAAEAAAAAAGVKGQSVQSTLFEFDRAAAATEFRREEDLRNAFVATDTQRRNIAMQAAVQQDYSFIKQPSLARTLLGIGSQALGVASAYWGAADAANMPQSGNSTNSGPAMHTKGTIAYAPTGGHGRLVP